MYFLALDKKSPPVYYGRPLAFMHSIFDPLFLKSHGVFKDPIADSVLLDPKKLGENL